MPFAIAVLLVVLSGVPKQTISTATVKASGHTYQLFCAQEGELILASDTGLCEKTESAGVQHIEIRNEAGDVQFSQDAPDGDAFKSVGIFSFANAGKEIIDVDSSHDVTASSSPRPVHVIYYFDPTAAGLVPFNPPLVDIDGFAQLPTGVALSRTFDAGFVQFSVLLDFNLLTHRIEIMPDQPAFSALPPRSRQKPGASSSPGSGELKLFANHDVAAPKTEIKLVPGHAVKWWQAPEMDDGPSAGQVVTILAAWAPASLRPADNAPEGVKMVYYDWNNLWLQIQVDQQTGWIKGVSSFRLIGLEMTSTRR
jgi:hypothetical protein